MEFTYKTPAANLCKQFQPRSDPTFCRAGSRFKLFHTDGIPERFVVEMLIIDENLQITLPRMQNRLLPGDYRFALRLSVHPLKSGSRDNSKTIHCSLKLSM